MALTPRRTLRVPDYEWNAGQAKAESEGDNLANVLRSLLSGYLAGHRIEYQVTSRKPINGVPQVIRGLIGPVEAIERLYRPSLWILEEYDVSPPRPATRHTHTN